MQKNQVGTLIHTIHKTGFPGGAVVKNLPAMQEKQETWFNHWVRKIPWSRKWQPTPALWPGDFQGQRNLVGYSPRGRRELDMTEKLTYTLFLLQNKKS